MRKLLNIGLIVWSVLTSARSLAVLPCLNPVTGAWAFGTVPTACDVSAQLDPATVRSEYGPVLFDETKPSSDARANYVSALLPTMREIGSRYLHRRNASVSDAETEGFLMGFYTLLSQESLWTHFRSGKDGIIRFMRGDSLHGYGIMQIDDRSYVDVIKAGKATDLTNNVLTGLDIFYSMWNRAATASCVSSPTNYRDRARSAWAAYNGGPGSICRWTNPSSAWAANDKGFLANYTTPPWKPYASALTASAPLAVRCLFEGVRPCRSTP